MLCKACGNQKDPSGASDMRGIVYAILSGSMFVSAAIMLANPSVDPRRPNAASSAGLVLGIVAIVYTFFGL
jgi:hypothetical protein